MLLECDQRFTVLPAHADIVAAAVLTLLDRKLVCHIHVSFSSNVIFANTQYPKLCKNATETISGDAHSTKATMQRRSVTKCGRNQITFEYPFEIEVHLQT